MRVGVEFGDMVGVGETEMEIAEILSGGDFNSMMEASTHGGDADY